MKRTILSLSLALFLAAILFSSCKDEAGTSTLQLKLTDAPTALDKVLIDIKEVKVNFAEDSLSGWKTLNTQAGIYDLLTLQNGNDTLLATGEFPSQTVVRQVRFVLGPNNSVVESGVFYPLTIPSGSESGLKIKVNKALNATLESMIIDFDAAASVKKENDGSYKLRPVLMVK